MYYFGIDHHKRYSQVAVVDEKGTVRSNGKIALMRRKHSLFLRSIIKNHVEQ